MNEFDENIEGKILLNETIIENYDWKQRLKTTTENYDWQRRLKTMTENYDWKLWLKTMIQFKATIENYDWMSSLNIIKTEKALPSSALCSWCDP